jgi:Fe-S cluster biosynthesis and repair protein YggX
MNVWVEQKVTGLNKNNLNLSNTVMEKALHKQIATTFLFSQN